MRNPNEMVHVEKMKSDIEPGVQVGDFASSDLQKSAQRSDSPEWINAQKRYLRKLDLVILPTISALYFFEYLDRGNVAV